ncbi:MAG TPA: biotin carboxylase N-terminal domain-containing protein [Solirubrobacteraceae bacterium]|jgi:acetyl-CoA carboxylase biotin carboxylase subunit|nr:biotin carboxylase N-terminal domain-containing protein [Solirubrobacteraceae bacterium]
MKRIERVFVANRGEIALRIVNACQELGLETVVGTSEADKSGLAAREADRAVCIGPAPASESYLRDDLVVQAALGTQCDAIHPGYGFLSESPKLAIRAQENGLIFIGPPPEVIELSGDKLRAREEAARAGVPVLPGREIAPGDDARKAGDEIGYPVLVKAAGGGGGRGIKLARDADELGNLVSLARSEAGAAFGDERVYLERFVANARHIEVQIAADEHGAVVHLGERDCSVQRRYQKVIEEAPAPDLGPAVRNALTAEAVAFANAIGYRNLGTVEFILDVDTGKHFFLEINCRIQVEHPVTEAVTGRDLVKLQIHIADGRPLGFAQGDVVFDGHAIECRLNAEDVARGFMPSPGTLSLFAVPENLHLRVDTALCAGATIPPYYDSLMAKLIGHAEGREATIDVLQEALEELDVEGVETNRMLLLSVLGHDDFQRGGVTTDWLERAIV